MKFTQKSSQPTPRQVNIPDQFKSTSVSKLDVSTLCLDNDSDDFHKEANPKGIHSAHLGHVSGHSDTEPNTVTQSVINQKKILGRLNVLGDRLAKIEKQNDMVNKSSEPTKVISSKRKAKKLPTVSLVHEQETKFLQDVQLRSQKPTENVVRGDGKIKSQRGGPVDVYVSNRVKWPHEFVLAGENKERVTYDQLSPIQWMAGFCRIMREETYVENKDFMLDYVINLLDDAADFSWDSAKASHAVLLCRMEQGEIKGWSDVEKIDRVRRAHAQRHVSRQEDSTSKSQERNYDSPSKISLCIYFNKNVCSQKETHKTKGVLYRHICSACWAKDKKAFAHSRVNCRRTKAQNK